MRWGNWFLQDDKTVIHLRTQETVDRRELETPELVDAWILDNAERLGLSAGEAIHLHIAANQLEWHAWNYQGLGDWTDEDGKQRGAGTGGPDRRGNSHG